MLVACLLSRESRVATVYFGLILGTKQRGTLAHTNLLHSLTNRQMQGYLLDLYRYA